MSIVSDTFTDTDSTTLASHTGETGATWTKDSGASTFDIQSNRARPVGASSYSASGVPPSADYDVIGIFTPRSTAAAAAWIVGRKVSGADTGYAVSPNANTGVLLFSRFSAGTKTDLGSFTTTFSVGTDYTVKLEMRGTTLNVYLNGTLRIGPITDSSITAKGNVGVRASAGAGTATGSHLASISAENPTNNDNPTGTLTLTGSLVESYEHAYQDSPTGQISVNLLTVTPGSDVYPSPDLLLGPTPMAESLGFADSPAGTIGIEGTSEDIWGLINQDTVDGTFVLSGAVVEELLGFPRWPQSTDDHWAQSSDDRWEMPVAEPL